MLGLLITGVLLAFKVRGALLIGIVITTIIGVPFASPNTLVASIFLRRRISSRSTLSSNLHRHNVRRIFSFRRASSKADEPD